MNKIISYFENLKPDAQFLENLLLSLIIFAFFYICSSVFSKIIIIIVNLKSTKNINKERNKDKTTTKEKINNKLPTSPLFKPLRIFFILLGIYLGLLNLDLPQDIANTITKFFRASIIWIIASCIANMITPTSLIFSKINKNIKYTKKDKATTLLFKIIKVIVYIVATVIIIAELGYDINGLIAGLGVGGLAVSLAAQDTLKNLIGGIVVIFDKPFIVGDWIETPTIEGTIEDITFRSTRIRTFKDSIVTIPNSIISNESIINWSKMNKRRITLDLVATFNTPLKNICNSISKIQEMLIEHPNVHNEPIYVNFTEIKGDGQNIQVYFYIDRTDYASYLAIKENINYKIMQILNQEKVELAYNTQTIYLAK